LNQDLFDTVPDTLNPNVTSYLVYNPGGDLPAPDLLDEYDDFDDVTLVPYDGEHIFPDADFTTTLAIRMINLGDGAN
jgi:iron transport multicopper oxidase